MDKKGQLQSGQCSVWVMGECIVHHTHIMIMFDIVNP